MLHKKIRHFSALTGTDVHLLDVATKSFESDANSFCSRCPRRCDYKNTHLYGCYESVRWDHKYIYCCPMDFTFVAVPVMGEYENPEKGVIIGPVLMGELSDFEETYGLPHMETPRVNDLTEVASALFSPQSGERAEYTGDFLNTVYQELELLPKSKGYPIDLEKRLQSAIVDGDEANAREYLNRLLGEIFFRSNGDPEIIKARVLELLVLLSRSAIEGGADVSQIFALNNDYIREIDRFESVEKLSGWLSGIINRFISYMFDFSDIKHSVEIHKITGYIRNNYMKKITLDDIAEYVYMSRSRVSKIFNEEMGMSVSSYINKVRVERAKRLLRDPLLSIADIANLTGFDDQSYFSKQFKTVIGVSPKKFREKTQ